MRDRLLPVAFYLPQYYPVPENDEWWGRGFSEWTTLARARSYFRGHSIPLPGELGFYDLRLSETRQAQMDLAREAGVSAFAFWHYWFDGKRMLERPFKEILEGSESGVQICLAWANESWTAVWQGRSRRVLLEQTYPGVEDHIAHVETLIPAFLDSRYLKLDGRPLFLIYRPGKIPDLPRMVDIWAERCQRNGLRRPFLVGEVDTETSQGRSTAASPHLDAVYDLSWRRAFGRYVAYLKRLPLPGRPLRRPYENVARDVTLQSPLGRSTVPLVVTGWDTTPRHGRKGLVATRYAPDALEIAVGRATRQVHDWPSPHGLMLLKSWNEWAEGNYLEPDTAHQRAWLRSLSRGLRG